MPGFMPELKKNQFRWSYTDPEADGSGTLPREGKEIKPFGMLELSIGLDF